MSNAVTVVIPQTLREKARDHRINISKISREALAVEVSKAEKEAEAEAGKQRASTAAPVKEGDTSVNT